jgi:iron complex outermembrane receptor protein
MIQLSAAALAAASMLAFVAAPAFAAPAVETPAGDAADAADNADGIVVTAQRRAEPLSQVPLSVGVLSADNLTDYAAGGADTLLSLSGKVPSLYVESTTGRIFPRFYIRGLGNVDFYLGASQPVSIIQDDVVLEHVVLKSNPVFDMNQVEVLRGPQGSLFGRNTTAGIIKFSSNQPTEDFHGQASVTYGTYGTINAEAGIGGPVSADKHIQFRLSGLVQHRDNWIDNTFVGTSADGTVSPASKVMGGFDERDVRGQLLFTSDYGFSAQFSAHLRDYRGTSTLFYRQSLTKGSNGLPANFDQSKVAFDEANNNPQAYKTHGVSAKLAYDFGIATVTSITAFERSHGYSRGDTDGGAAANFPVNGVPNGFGQSQGQLRDLKQFSEELRVASNGNGPFKWQFGAIYFDSRDTTEFDQRAYFLTTAAYNPNNYVVLRNVNTSTAAFGQASYEFTPQLTVTAGARETTDIRDTYLLKTANTQANVVSYTGRTFVRLSATKPSFDLSVLYKATPNVNLYARVARGFRGPTIQGRSAVFNSDFTTANAETNTSFEGGLKSTFLNHKGHFSLSGFYYTVKNIQLNGNDSNGNGVLFNADKAKGYGMEAEFDISPMQGLKFNAGLSLLHTEINDKRVYAQVCALNGVVVCTVMNPTIKIGANTFAQIDGNPLPNAPKYNLNLGARYEVPVGPGKVFVSGDFNKQGYTSFVLYKSAEFNAKGSYELGLKGGFTTDRLEFAVFARNLTNQHNLIGVIENFMAGVYNEPRVVGGSISAHF